MTDGDSPRDIYRNGRKHLATSSEFVAAAEVLVDCGWIALERSPSGEKGGRPPEVIRINPELWA